MIHLFTPDLYYESFRSINLDKVCKRKKKLILCDLDNTLVAHDEALPNEEVLSFVKAVQERQLMICLISNNHERRVQLFASKLSLPYYSFAKKPLKVTYRKIMKDYKISVHEMIVVGDQLLTDVFGAKRMKIDAILTKPLYQKDLKSTKINRRLEELIYSRLERKGKLKRGIFDE